MNSLRRFSLAGRAINEVFYPRHLRISSSRIFINNTILNNKNFSLAYLTNCRTFSSNNR